jgi:hypothetical protein
VSASVRALVAKGNARKGGSDRAAVEELLKKATELKAARERHSRLSEAVAIKIDAIARMHDIAATSETLKSIQAVLATGDERSLASLAFKVATATAQCDERVRKAQESIDILEHDLKAATDAVVGLPYSGKEKRGGQWPS